MATAADFPENVRLKLNIFDPNARGGANKLDFEVPVGTTVDALKAKIAAELGLVPDMTSSSISSMRVIYSGKLLDDGKPLFSILRRPEAEDNDADYAYALHAVLPLQKSTKEKYEHQVSRSGETNLPGAGRRNLTRVVSAPVTPYMSANATPLARRQQSAAARPNTGGNTTRTMVGAASAGGQGGAAAAAVPRPVVPASPELTAARAAAGAAAARYRARTGSSTMADFSLGDSASSPGSSSADPQSPLMQPQRPSNLPRRILQTPPMHPSPGPQSPALPHTAPFPGQLPQLQSQTNPASGSSLAQQSSPITADSLEEKLETLRQQMQQLGLQVPAHPQSPAPTPSPGTGLYQLSQPQSPHHVLLLQQQQHLHQQMALLQQQMAAAGLPGNVGAFSPQMPPFNVGLGSPAFGLGAPPGMLSFSNSPGFASPPMPYGMPGLTPNPAHQHQFQQRLAAGHVGSMSPSTPQPASQHQYPPGLGLTPEIQQLQERLSFLAQQMQESIPGQDRPQGGQQQGAPGAGGGEIEDTIRQVANVMQNATQALYEELHRNAEGFGAAEGADGVGARAFAAEAAAQAAHEGGANAVGNNEGDLGDDQADGFEARLAADMEAVHNPENDAGDDGGPGNMWFRLSLLAKIAFFTVVLGQDGGFNRYLMLAAMGTIIFMWQDGWLERFRNRRGVQAGLDGRVDVRQFQERSIVAGGISPRDPRRGCCAELLNDIMYMFGTFFLAVLPWWRPRRNTHLDRYFAEQEAAQRAQAEEAEAAIAAVAAADELNAPVNRGPGNDERAEAEGDANDDEGQVPTVDEGQVPTVDELRRAGEHLHED